MIKLLMIHQEIESMIWQHFRKVILGNLQYLLTSDMLVH